MRIRCLNPNRATKPTPSTPTRTAEPTSATSPREIALYPFTIFRERLFRPSRIKTFAARPISLPLYRDVVPPVTKSESCLRHSLKRNEKMASGLIRTEYSHQISVSISVSHPTLCRYLSLTMAAVQPQPLTPGSSTLPIYLFFLRVTCEQKAKYCPELPSTPLRSFVPQPPSLPPSPTPLPRLKNFPFPNPTSALYRLSYTPGSLCRCPPRSAFLRQTTSSLFRHLFTALERRQTSYRKDFGWKWEWSHRRVADNITLSDPFELGWIRNAIGLENL